VGADLRPAGPIRDASFQLDAAKSGSCSGLSPALQIASDDYERHSDVII
jgi:hypothetical protein